MDKQNEPFPLSGQREPEPGVFYPLNRMCTLYYESTDDGQPAGLPEMKTPSYEPEDNTLYE